MHRMLRNSIYHMEGKLHWSPNPEGVCDFLGNHKCWFAIYRVCDFLLHRDVNSQSSASEACTLYLFAHGIRSNVLPCQDSEWSGFLLEY